MIRLAPGEDIRLEAHHDWDQFLRSARVEFGRTEESVDEKHEVSDDWTNHRSDGVWHNVINAGEYELKLVLDPLAARASIGDGPRTKADADEHHA